MLVGATTLVLVLSGCAQGPTPVPTVAPTEAPTATVEPAVRPNPVFAIDCAELLSLDDVQARLDVAIAIKRDESSVPSEFWDIPALQQGALSCRWGGDNRTGSSFDDGVDLLLLPDAADEYAFRSVNGFEQAVEVAGADAAVTQCGFSSEPEGDGAPGYCTVFSLVGSTLVELRFSDSQGSYASEKAIGDVAIELLELAIARALDAGSRSQEWEAPTSTIEADTAFCDSVGAALLDELGVETPYGGPAPLDGYPGVSGCQYSFGATDVIGVGAWVVDGAAWAAGVEQTEGPFLGEPFAVRTTASGAQWWLSSTGPAVHGRAAMGGSLVELVVYWVDFDGDVDQATAAIVAVMERFAEAPPGT